MIARIHQLVSVLTNIRTIGILTQSCPNELRKPIDDLLFFLSSKHTRSSRLRDNRMHALSFLSNSEVQQARFAFSRGTASLSSSLSILLPRMCADLGIQCTRAPDNPMALSLATMGEEFCLVVDVHLSPSAAGGVGAVTLMRFVCGDEGVTGDADKQLQNALALADSHAAADVLGGSVVPRAGPLRPLLACASFLAVVARLVAQVRTIIATMCIYLMYVLCLTSPLSHRSASSSVPAPTLPRSWLPPSRAPTRRTPRSPPTQPACTVSQPPASPPTPGTLLSRPRPPSRPCTPTAPRSSTTPPAPRSHSTHSARSRGRLRSRCSPRPWARTR
jgi:hypothetical protein